MNILWNENRLTDIGNRLVIINGREMGGYGLGVWD